MARDWMEDEVCIVGLMLLLWKIESLQKFPHLTKRPGQELNICVLNPFHVGRYMYECACMYIYGERKEIISDQGLHHQSSRKILIDLSSEVSGSKFLTIAFRTCFLVNGK